MAQFNQTDNRNSVHKAINNDAVVDITKYQTPEEKVSSETSAFEQVMSQMNIADRHAFDVQYEQYWQQASADGELLSVLVCEIDFFKAYNDHYGHQGSAFMLLVIGLALKNTCEKHGCFLARYRNCEFAILIKGSDVEAAQKIAESLRVAVEESRTEHKHSKVSDVVTLSIGISSVYPVSMQVLMQESVGALHSAKKSGRNQVCSSAKLESTKAAPVSHAVDTQEVEAPQQRSVEGLMSGMQLYDRRDFNRYFLDAWQETSRDKELLSMVISELDFFDEYTHNYGQQSSEDIILLVACTLKNTCDHFDCFVAHLGEGKFAVLVKGGNATKGLKVAEALRTSVQELDMEHAYSPVKNRLTMSLGLSNIFPSDENSMKSLMAKVDVAIGEAKSSGYDQISVV